MKKRYVNGLLVTVPDYITSVNFTKVPINGNVLSPEEYRGEILPLSQPYRILIDNNRNQINIFYREGLLTSDITNNKYITVVKDVELTYEGKCNPTETFVVNGIEYIRTTKNLLSYKDSSISNFSDKEGLAKINVEDKILENPVKEDKSQDFTMDYAYSRHSNNYNYNSNKNTNTDFDIETISIYLIHYNAERKITENKFVIHNNSLYIALIDTIIKDWTVDDYINYLNSTEFVYCIKTDYLVDNINYLPNTYSKISDTPMNELRKGITNNEPQALNNIGINKVGFIKDKYYDNTIDNHYDDIKLHNSDSAIYKYGVNSTSESGYRPMFNTPETFLIVNIYNHYFDNSSNNYNDISITGLVDEFYVNDAVIIADFIRQLRGLYPEIQFYTREEDKDTTKFNEWINYNVTPSDIKSSNYFTSHVWDRPTWGRVWQTSVRFELEYCANDIEKLLARRDNYRIGNFLFKHHKFKYIIKDAKGNDFNLQYCILWDRDNLSSEYNKSTSQDEVGYSQFTYKYTGQILYTNLEHAPKNVYIVERVIYDIMFANQDGVLPPTKNVDDYETQLVDTDKVMEEHNWNMEVEDDNEPTFSEQTIHCEYPNDINKETKDVEDNTNDNNEIETEETNISVDNDIGVIL